MMLLRTKVWAWVYVSLIYSSVMRSTPWGGIVSTSVYPSGILILLSSIEGAHFLEFSKVIFIESNRPTEIDSGCSQSHFSLISSALYSISSHVNYFLFKRSSIPGTSSRTIESVTFKSIVIAFNSLSFGTSTLSWAIPSSSSLRLRFLSIYESPKASLSRTNCSVIFWKSSGSILELNLNETTPLL